MMSHIGSVYGNEAKSLVEVNDNLGDIKKPSYEGPSEN